MGRELISLWKPFKRVFGLPLDASTLYSSYEEALKYTTTKKTAYSGQIISVLENTGSGYTISEAYIISENESGKTLVPLQSITYDLDFSGYTIPAGTSFTDALQGAIYILESGITEAAKSGVINKDITITDKETGELIIIAHDGDTTTEAFQSVAKYLYEHGGGGGIANITTKDKEIFKIYNESNETYIDFIGITNPEITIE